MTNIVNIKNSISDQFAQQLIDDIAALESQDITMITTVLKDSPNEDRLKFRDNLNDIISKLRRIIKTNESIEANAKNRKESFN